MEPIKWNILHKSFFLMTILTIVSNIGMGQALCPRNSDAIPGDVNREMEYGVMSATPYSGRMREIVVTTEVSHQQRGIREDFEHTKKIRSSSDFVKKHKDISGSYSASVGIKGFGASVDAKFRVVLTDVTDRKRFSHDEKTTKRIFQLNTLQIFRVIKTTISIDGVSATTEERDWIDTVPVSQRLSTSKRHQMSKDYISRRYKKEDGEFIHDGTGFTFTACQLQLTIKYFGHTACYQKGSPFCKSTSTSATSSLKSCVKDSLEWEGFEVSCCSEYSAQLEKYSFAGIKWTSFCPGEG